MKMNSQPPKNLMEFLMSITKSAESEAECPGCAYCKNESGLNYEDFESTLGELFRLIIVNTESQSGYSYCSSESEVEYSTFKGSPLFFDAQGNFRLATDYSIVFPMIYVRTSIIHVETMEKTYPAFIH
jgi:hypothetical protein